VSWFKVDDNLHSHKKATKAGVEAMGLWVLAGSWAADQLTDGWVPNYMAQRWAGNSAKLAARLVSVGLWTAGEHDGDSGWWFHQWAERQPARADVEAKRVDARERMRQARSSKRSLDVRANTESITDEQEAKLADCSHNPVPSRPVVPNGTTVASGRKRPAHRLKDDWAPTSKHHEKATERGLDVDYEAEQMRLWAQSKDERKVDWDAAFLGWLGRSTTRQSGTVATPETAEKWLRENWQAGTAKAVTDRSGLGYYAPDNRGDTSEEYREVVRDDVRRWITEHHDEIIRRVVARESQAA